MSVDHPWLSSLNPVQGEAAAYSDGPLLVVAGAGSGKTRVIVHRIAHLIRGRNVDPREILAVTFTNKAAEEMKNRVASLLEFDAHHVWVSTFHSLGAQILRRHIDRLGYYDSSFVIYDDSDQQSLLKKVIKDKGHDPKKLTPRKIRGLIDLVKREARLGEDIENYHDRRVSRYADIIGEYQNRLIESNAVDFGDLLLLTYRLFVERPEVLAEYRERFKHIMVDEYQDTNRVQYLIVRALASETGNICVVGDEDQSIYGWRGADISNILGFERDFPGAKVVMLEQNYRSTRTIIEAASDLIGHNEKRKPKRLWTDNEEGDLIRLYSARDEREEARWVIEEVRRVKSMGTSLSDMAVFYRTHAQSRVFEDQLRQANLAYSVYGGPRFYDRKEIKDIIAYLKFINNTADEVSLMRVINEPARGIGAKTVDTVERVKREEEIGWTEAVDHVVGRKLVSGRSVLGLKNFLELVEDMREIADGPIGALCEAVIERSGYRKMLEDEDSVESATRLENLDELINAMVEHQQSSDQPDLQGFLEKVSLASDIDGFDPEAASLTLMTIHSAKGLEFPVVFMVGLEDGVFPHIRSLMEMEDDDDSGALEEERRLCYVGMTRAERMLYMTWAQSRATRGFREKSDRSMFLAEVPDKYIQNVWGGGSVQRPVKKSGVKKKGQRKIDFGDSELVYDDSPPTGSMELDSGVTLNPGDRVRHPSYGVGSIVRFEESGERLKVVVKFAGRTKKFLAKFAPLSPA